MTEYKPWFERVSSIIEQSNSEGVDYKSEYLRMLEENITLRLMRVNFTSSDLGNRC